MFAWRLLWVFSLNIDCNTAGAGDASDLLARGLPYMTRRRDCADAGTVVRVCLEVAALPSLRFRCSVCFPLNLLTVF